MAPDRGIQPSIFDMKITRVAVLLSVNERLLNSLRVTIVLIRCAYTTDFCTRAVASVPGQATHYTVIDSGGVN